MSENQHDRSSEGPGTLLETVILFTERLEALAGFYREGLGIGPFQPSPRHLGCHLGPLYFGFDQVDKVEGSPPAGVTLWFTVDDLQATFDRLVSLGAQVKFPPTEKPWGATLAAVYDLDGNLLGLSQRPT
jgi:predicted enzyme related to lactoylglutathione lyase